MQLEEYKPQNGIFIQEDLLTHKLKNIVFNDLTEIDRNIIILYSEKQSQREVAKILGVSLRTINKKINEIRDKIKTILKEDGNKYN